MNGAWLLVLPLAVSLALWPQLPEAYSQELFQREIPPWVSWPENILRLFVFALPVIFSMKSTGGHWYRAWAAYAIGVVIYLGSYLAQIIAPLSAWSVSLIGFTAPAWTTTIWLLAIASRLDSARVLPALKRKHYGLLVIVFVFFHTTHAAFAWEADQPTRLG